MKIRSIKYYFEEAFKSLFRNSLMSVTSILTVSACILILVFSYCVAANVEYILKNLENTVGITVFIDDNLTKEEVTKLNDELIAIDNVKEVRFISSEEALESMAESLGENSDIIMGLKDRNPIRRSFSINLESSRLQGQTIKTLEQMMENGSGIVKVKHAKETIDILITINNIITAISAIIVLVLGLLSIIIIMNTIKLTVNSRKNNISIMKYVGATDWFIRWPFIIEGILIGILGAAIPVFISSLVYSQVTDLISSKISLDNNLISFMTSIEVFSTLAPAMMILGLFIGSLGSAISIRRYLDV